MSFELPDLADCSCGEPAQMWAKGNPPDRQHYVECPTCFSPRRHFRSLRAAARDWNRRVDRVKRALLPATPWEPWMVGEAAA